MRGLLIERADALMGCTEGSPEEAELATLKGLARGVQHLPEEL